MPATKKKKKPTERALKLRVVHLIGGEPESTPDWWRARKQGRSDVALITMWERGGNKILWSCLGSVLFLWFQKRVNHSKERREEGHSQEKGHSQTKVPEGGRPHRSDLAKGQVSLAERSAEGADKRFHTGNDTLARFSQFLPCGF